jgi:hypothetical protein
LGYTRQAWTYGFVGETPDIFGLRCGETDAGRMEGERMAGEGAVAETAVAEQVTPQEQYVSRRDLDTLRSIKDREISDVRRSMADQTTQLQYERQQREDLQRRLDALEAAGYEDDAPEVRQLRQERQQFEREAREARQAAERVGSQHKDLMASEKAWSMFPTDSDKRNEAKALLLQATSPAQMDEIARRLQGLAPAPPKAPAAAGSEEFDDGRSTGRGAGVVISQQTLAENQNNPEFWGKYGKEIDAWLARGAP